DAREERLREASTREIAAPPVLPPNPRFGAVLRAIGGIAAIGVKELRGRMRGRRAFIILTIYLLLLGGFALMVEQIMEQQFQNPFPRRLATGGTDIAPGAS